MSAQSSSPNIPSHPTSAAAGPVPRLSFSGGTSQPSACLDQISLETRLSAKINEVHLPRQSSNSAPSHPPPFSTVRTSSMNANHDHHDSSETIKTGEGQCSSNNTTLNASYAKQVNYLFQLKDPILRKQYLTFNAEQESPMFAIMLSLVFVYAILICVAVLVRDVNGASTQMQIASSFMVLGTSSTSIVGAVYAYYQFAYNHAKEQEDEEKTEQYLSKKTTASLVFCMCAQIFIAGYAIRRALGPLCTYDHDVLPHGFATFLNYYFCGGHEEYTVMTVDSGFMLLLGPIAMTSVFPSIDVSLIWVLSMSSVVLFSIIVGVNGHVPSIIIFVLWIFGSVFLIADLQIARIKSFLLFLRLNDLIQENARLAEEFHSSEMRFLIANVAHDLKTVSFISIIPSTQQPELTAFLFLLYLLI